MLPSRRRRATAGFVLPTTVLLVLVVTLTASALSYRAFNNSSRVIGNVAAKQIYNAATPSVDRARAKLDFLFGKDTRLPGGVPGEEFMISMMLNAGAARPIGVGTTSAPALTGTFPGAKVNDPYTLVDETRVDINGDGLVDNAWVYTDPGTNNSVIYSINMSTPDDPAATAPGSALSAYKLLQLKESEKATGDNGGPFVRSAPLSNNKAVDCPGSGSKIEQGWYEDAIDTSILRKRFQVNSFVVNPADVNSNKPSNYATLEFAQDRQLDRGNKWGAWFRYDLEIFPGTAMSWNGAMHSEGNILIGGSNFTSYLISSQNSCLFLPRSNSQVSVREFTEQLGSAANAFKGVIAAGLIRTNEFGGTARMHTYNNNTYDSAPLLEPGTDWLTGTKLPIGIASDPVAIVTDDLQRARQADTTNADSRLADPKQQDATFYDKRFEVELKNTRPYVDDTYRADNRWGPKVQYKGEAKFRIPAGSVVGSTIDPARLDMVSDSASTGGDVGLDGYWERRTFAGSAAGTYSGGMRILVGERLELGNPSGWVAPQDRPDTTRQDPNIAPTAGDGTWEDLRTNTYGSATLATAVSDASDNEGDPLNPPYKYTDTARAHESKQRRALRDNLAAVQASAIYHYRANNGRFPAACLITTSHPGSPQTLAQSVNFAQPSTSPADNFGVDGRFDFFSGKGTNGWEFEMTPATFDSGAMQQALRNLANFAGDYDPSTTIGGAFPPSQTASGNRVYPDPALTMFGNFSNLRRAINTAAASRSPADESYMHTAACTLGALGYNINQIQSLNLSDTSNTTLQTALYDLALQMEPLMDGEAASPNDEVLPKTQLATYNYSDGGTLDKSKFNPRDYDQVTPDMFLVALKKRLGGATIEENPTNYRLYRLAELIHESYQIRRDRTYGFRPSPAANTWNFNPYMVEYRYQLDTNGDGTPDTNYGKATLWSSACDPYLFNVSGTVGKAAADIAKPVEDEARQRLALSRLCGTILPPGGIHDYPGDYSYPARNGIVNPPDAEPQFIPKSTNEASELKDLVGTPARGVTTNSAFTTSDTPINTGDYLKDEFRYASVAPKFPVLYYIFPEFDHAHLGAKDTNGDHRQPGAVEAVPAAFQPWVEPYLSGVSSTLNSTITYQPVNSAAPGLPASPGYEATNLVWTDPYDIRFRQPGASLSDPDDDTTISVNSLKYKTAPVFLTPDQSAALGVTPRGDLTTWVLPNSSLGSANSYSNNGNTAPPNLIRYGDAVAGYQIGAIPFLDRVLFDGRQWLPNRVLDVDLNMLRNTSPGGASDENWLPVSGIVYAFREDARREDAISRPANALGFTDAQDPANETDPAIRTDKFNISIKPIDYIADPDRRDHGFRLRNGASLKRSASGIPSDFNRGLSFISDNSVYFLGNFNVHNNGDNGTGDRLEEFTVQLPNTPSYSDGEFYDNRTRATRDTDRFAEPTVDFWRPSEILADSITILSKDFCDGSIIDTFMSAGEGAGNIDYTLSSSTSSGTDNTNFYSAGGNNGAAVYNNQSKALFGPGCNSNGGSKATSFLNQNRPSGDLTNLQWTREIPDDLFSPIKISRNGNGLVAASSSGVPTEYGATGDPERANHSYMTVRDGGAPYSTSRPRQIPFGTRGTEDVTNVNSIMIGGIIPSRELQPYGGMHNFPRLLERWEGVPMRIAGSFLQLNFSNYATGPFDQEVWEPDAAKSIAATEGNDMNGYFGFAPDRLWGYDVALKLASPSPAASRFTTPSTERNEFYEEPKVNDPYIQRLCAALKSAPAGGGGVPNLKCPT